MDGCLHTMDQQGLGEFIADQDGLLTIIEQLRGGAKQRWPFAEVKATVEELVKHYLVDRNDGQGGACLSYPLPVNPALTWHRVRKLEEDWRDWTASDLGAPPANKTTAYGRCHVPGEPVCYCAMYEDIALAEMNAEVGKRYAIVTYELTDELIVAPVGEFDYFRRTGQTYLGSGAPENKKEYEKVRNGQEGRLREFVDAFFAEEFLAPVRREAEYQVTAAISTILLCWNVRKDPIDAIFYPSVAFRAGYNLAIRPEAVAKKMRLLPGQTRIVRVKEAMGYGIFETEDEYILKAEKDSALEWEKVT